MPGTVTPAQMFDNELNVSKGWPSPYALDKTKPVGAGETLLKAGRVGHIDPATDKVKVGCPVSGTDYAAMPLFLWPNQTDFDVASDVGNISGGNIVALVGSGAYELESTEFMGGGPFTPNRPLVVHNTADADKGKLKVGTTDDAATIVGIISDDSSSLTNEFGKDYIRFWSVYLPPR